MAFPYLDLERKTNNPAIRTQLTIIIIRSTVVKLAGPMESITTGNPVNGRGFDLRMRKINPIPAVANPIEAKKVVV
jgi:hypothetical protein